MTKRFESLEAYITEIGIRKSALAERLGISRYRMSALLYPNRYSISVEDELVTKLAALLGQSEAHIRKLYAKKAA